MQTTETILWKKFISGDEEAFHDYISHAIVIYMLMV